MQHTPDQAAVIKAPPGNLLVSAAAGSGKTAVLTDRIVRRIIDRELEIRQVLVMTFTEAAARNMKEKIEKKLRDALAETTERDLRQHLGRQIAQLPGASISTIHAFCLDVIRNFYTCARDEKGEALIEPGFSVDDGVEADLLLRQSLDDYLSEQYEAIDAAGSGEDGSGDASRQAAFYRLIDGFGAPSGDQPVRDLMIRLLRFLRSLPDYENLGRMWLDQLKLAATSFSATAHMDELLRQLRLLLDRALEPADEMAALLAGGIRLIGQPDRNVAYIRQFTAILADLRQLDAYMKTGGRDWDQIRQLGQRLSSIDVPRASKNDSPEKSAFLDLFCRCAAEVVYCLSGQCGTDRFSKHFVFKTRYLFGLSSAEIQSDIAAMIPVTEVLFDLVSGLDRRYTDSKRAAGLIDFSDFEHLALRILREDEPRQYYRGRFQEVYVDEYQDTSSIQEKIIEAVSGGSCLMVGDIKQSIYRFRHARPRIFIDRAERYQRDPAAGTLYELNKNFRSVAGILAAANDLFSQLMSREAGEIDYDHRQALTRHREDSQTQPRPACLLLVNSLPRDFAGPADQEGQGSGEAGDESGGEETAAVSGLDAAELNRVETEAVAVAAKMLTLHRAGTPWQDMVVLGRTRAIVQACRSQLEKLAVPVRSDAAGTFLDTPVMRQMEALMHLIDNIRQDIPLAAVLRSEIFRGGFSDEELVRIRLFACEQPGSLRFFHEAALAYAEAGSHDSLRSRLSEFFSWLASVREREQILSLGELIGLIFDETGWLDRLAAHPAGRGETQISQLRQFRQWAEQFEASRPRGLHAFTLYLDSLRERGGIESPFESVDSQDDAVRIMTIHGSKGLEFPVVFLVGTSYVLTPKDSKDHLLISEKLGIGLDYADPERQIRYPTHLKLAMLEEIKAAGLAEEMRLLYVAMTRAMDQLFIVGSVRISCSRGEKQLSALLNQTRAAAARQLPAHLVLAGKSYLEWLIMTLARAPGLDLDWLSGGAFPAGDACTDIWRIEYLSLESVLSMLAAESADRPAAQHQEIVAEDAAALVQQVLDQPGQPSAQEVLRIAAPYRFESAARTPVKLTVSELKRREQAVIEPGEDDRAARPTDNGPRGIPLELREWPDSGMTGRGEVPTLAAPELGTLLHTFFRYMDLDAATRQPDRTEIGRQLSAMQAAGIYSAEDLAALAPFIGAFTDFAGSDLAAAMSRALKRPGRPLYAEMPFTLALPACQVHPEKDGLAADDQVFVQGIIDCWFEDVDGTTLVDYKSDHLPEEPLICQTELEQRYSLQLEYYARAILAATGKPVRRRLIWLIRQSRAYELPSKNLTCIGE